MPLFIWKPSYDTGVPEIDYDHRQLVGIINELYEAMKNGHGYELMNQTIDRLLEYTQRHFATEESFMRIGRYPRMANHEEEHRQFCEKVAELDAKRRCGRQLPSTEMMDFLCEWLRTHVTTTDKEMGLYLKRTMK